MSFAVGDRVVVHHGRYPDLDTRGVLVERPDWATREGCLWLRPDGYGTGVLVVQADELEHDQPG